MRRDHVSLWSPGLEAAGDVIAYGHFGRPVLAFPAERGRAWDYEDNGMVGAVAPLLEAGRIKLYCVDSFDAASWSAHHLPLEERARQHQRYEDWIIDQVTAWIREDCGGWHDSVVTGCSLGAYHAANLALRRADLFPVAICLSGVYDMGRSGWGERGDSFYFHNPADYVANLHGDHLDWLRSRLHLVLVCGQGQWEDTTGALEGSRRFAEMLSRTGVPHELDLWGYDMPHDWPSWRSQIAHHLPRFC